MQESLGDPVLIHAVCIVSGIGLGIVPMLVHPVMCGWLVGYAQTSTIEGFVFMTSS